LIAKFLHECNCQGDRPSDWAFDITKMLFGAHIMLMAAYGLRHHVHVEVDVIKRSLSRKSRRRSTLLAT